MYCKLTSKAFIWWEKTKEYIIISKFYKTKVCNIIVNHPSCSRQHAVIQYRKTEGTIK